MNCKPGDLAVCIRSAKVRVPADPLGRMCTVLYAAPLHGDFRLPDGYLQAGSSQIGDWVVEWQSEIAYPLENGNLRWTRFGLAPDFALRPIRDPGEDARDESLSWLPVPQKETQWT